RVSDENGCSERDLRTNALFHETCGDACRAFAVPGTSWLGLHEDRKDREAVAVVVRRFPRRAHGYRGSSDGPPFRRGGAFERPAGGEGSALEVQWSDRKAAVRRSSSKVGLRRRNEPTHWIQQTLASFSRRTARSPASSSW